MGACSSAPSRRGRAPSYVASESDWNQMYADVCSGHDQDKLMLSQNAQATPTRAKSLLPKRLRTMSKFSVVTLADALVGGEASDKRREVNGYSINSTLGKGAFGTVYLASRASEQYAIKVMKRPPPQVWHPAMKRDKSTFSTIKVCAQPCHVTRPACGSGVSPLLPHSKRELPPMPTRHPRS